MKKTARGFAIYGDYKDSRDQRVRVQESSAADGPRVWIFCHDKDGKDAIVHLGQPMARSPHLTPVQARRVAAALLKFADENEQ